jgi:hypothetical protein
MRTAALAVAFAAVSCGSAAAATAPPVTLQLGWNGRACNEDGKVTVTLTNVGRADLAVPALDGLGPGHLFIARVERGEAIVASTGHGFASPQPPDALTPAKVVILRPGESRTYPIVLGDMAADKLDGFGRAYQAARVRSGRIDVLYALDTRQRRASADPINSNVLVCPLPR